MWRVLVVCMCFLLVPYVAVLHAEGIPVGASSFEFVDDLGNVDRPITAWTYRPPNFRPTDPIVFVMHGQGRNGREYRDSWLNLAQRNRFLLVTPEFSFKQYPSEEMYQRGFVEADDGAIREPEKWSLMAIEHLFDKVVRDNGLAAKRYFIYGHSGGGQFVHRLVLLCPKARFELAISANPGWYTMPDLAPDYPYGLDRTPADAVQLKTALSKQLVVLLGDRDVDPNHASLRRTPEEMAQGSHRFERGQRFYQAAKSAADELATDFNWRLVTVPGVAHDNSKMAPAAADVIAKWRRSSSDGQRGESARPTKATSK